jgi:hypothetical protein
MRCELIPIELSEEQQAQVCGILSVGCDRQTASDFLGCSLGDLRRAMRQNSTFAAQVRRAEARAELSHMQIVHESSSEKKNWRASIWWLERRSPERFARRAGAVTSRQLKAFVAILVDIFGDEIRDVEDRQRVGARLNRVVDSLEQILRDSQPDVDGSLWELATPPEMDAGEPGGEPVASAGLDQ